MRPSGGLLRLAPGLMLAVCAAPILAGLVGMGLPLLRGDGFARLTAWPGLPFAIRLSLLTGIASTLMALIITLLLIAALAGSPAFALMRRALSPLLAVPHAAAALGLAFLLAPSGWVARALSPWATGWQVPPDILILNDPAGLSLTLGLVVKEVPFLLLMSLAALPQTDAARHAQLAASLGYGRVWGFVLTTLPGLYRQLRLPVFAVLAYAMTSVEMALILGPSLPPTLAVQIAKWMSDPSLAQLGTAAAGAFLQLALVAGTLALWLLAEPLIARMICACAILGHRGRGADRLLRLLAQGAGLWVTLSLGLGLAGLALWSVAGLWQFPDAFPDALTLRTWSRALPDLMSTAATTLTIALAATALAMALVLACLESAARQNLTLTRSLWLIYLPLLVPQIAFLPGLQVLALTIGAPNGLPTVIAAHLIFVLPYSFLSLAPAYLAWDNRQAIIARTLGGSANRIFWHLRLPMLLAPLLTAFAVGLAVSIGQYLPTLLIGGGRIETLTTEAVALSSGGNRRLIGAYGLLQTLLPALGFALALTLPRMAFANRRAMLAERGAA